ncbi:MAG: hypothetical protein AAF438_17940 [Pseudomonadota bacterium]
MSNLGLIVLASIVSSFITAAVLMALIRYWWIRQGRQQVDEEIELIGEQLQEKVRQGVKNGISDGIEELPKDMVRSTTRTVTQTGLDIVEEGISTLLGGNRKK